MTRIGVTKGDITEADVDIVVNAANRQLVPGGGVDGAIHAAGGPAIAAETKKIRTERGELESGEAVLTTAGALKAKHVIHTAGPIWGEVSDYEAVQDLAACYHNSLDVAATSGCRSIAFPNISTGIYRFPLRLAAETAISTVKTWVSAHPSTLEEIVFVCFNDENHVLYEELLG